MSITSIPKVILQNFPLLARFRNDDLLRHKAGNLFTVSGAIALLNMLRAFPLGFPRENLRGENVAPVKDTDAAGLGTPKKPRKNKTKGGGWKRRNFKQRQAQDPLAHASKNSVKLGVSLMLEEPGPEAMKDHQASQKKFVGCDKEKEKGGHEQVPSQNLAAEGSLCNVENNDAGKGDKPCVIATAEDISIGVIDVSDPKAHLPVPQKNITRKPHNPGHDILSWIACYDDSCPVHFSEKNSTGYFPRRPWRNRS